MSNGPVRNGSTRKRVTDLSNLKGGGKDVFVHISAVERAGLRELREGQRVAFEVVVDRKTGKSAAERSENRLSDLFEGEIRETVSPFSEHDPEKWQPVFRKDHAPLKSLIWNPLCGGHLR